MRQRLHAGDCRDTTDDNLLPILTIGTLAGRKQADGIAMVPGVTAILAGSCDISNVPGYHPGGPDCEPALDIVHDAAIEAGV